MPTPATTTRVGKGGWLCAALCVGVIGAARAQTFTGSSVVFSPSGSNAAQTQTANITLAAASTIRSISIPVGFTSIAPEFTLIDQGGCTEDGTTVNPAGTVCNLIVRFRPAAAGLRTGSLIVTDGSGNATAFGLSGVGYYPQIALTPVTANIAAGIGPNLVGTQAASPIATTAQIGSPEGLATDSFGNTYIVDSPDGKYTAIQMLDAFGNLTTVAGGGTVTGAAADGGPATAAQLSQISFLTVDAAGNLYFSDSANSVVWRVAMSTNRLLTVVAGNFTFGFSGDGGPARSAQLHVPLGLVTDAIGNLYISDSQNQRVRRVDTAGVITTFAGSGAFGFDAGTVSASSARFGYPSGLAMATTGELYLGENGSIRKISGGMVSVAAGTGTLGYSGDGGPATSAKVYLPEGLAISPGGDIYFVDGGSNVVRKVQASDGVIETIVGDPSQSQTFTGGSVPVPSTSIGMLGPFGLAFDSQANLYIADSGHNVVRKITAAPGELQFYAPPAATSPVPQTLKIANIGNAPLSLVNIAAANSITSTNFTLANSSTTPCGASVAAGQHCEYTVSFAPATAGFVGGEMDVTHLSNNPNFNTVEPVYLVGGALTPITIGPASLATATSGTGYNATVTATGGYGAITMTTSGSLPPGVGTTISGGVVTLSGTPTAIGSYTFTVYASDLLGETTAQTYTLQVQLATITFALTETIHVTDSAVETPGLVLNLTETVHVSDGLSSAPQLSLAVMETVHVLDGIVNTPSLTLNVTESVHVADGIVNTPGLTLAVIEAIHVTDTIVNTPGLILTVNETIHVADAPRSILSGGVIVLRNVTLANNAGTLTQFSNSVAVVSGPSGTASAASGGMAFDAAGNAWVVTSGSNSLDFVSHDGTVSTSYTGGGLNQPVSVAIDGSGHVWVTNGNGSVSEFSGTGVALSPSTGFTGGTTGYSSPTGISIGLSGSVWVANSGNNTATEILGAAAPAAPLATALTNSTTGVRP